MCNRICWHDCPILWIASGILLLSKIQWNFSTNRTISSISNTSTDKITERILNLMHCLWFCHIISMKQELRESIDWVFSLRSWHRPKWNPFVKTMTGLVIKSDCVFDGSVQYKILKIYGQVNETKLRNANKRSFWNTSKPLMRLSNVRLHSTECTQRIRNSFRNWRNKRILFSLYMFINNRLYEVKNVRIIFWAHW